MTKHQYSCERSTLLNLINGDCFFSVKSWPRNMVLRFFSKPQNDKDTLILYLFFIGRLHYLHTYIPLHYLQYMLKWKYSKWNSDTCFSLGNGCSPHVMVKWLLSSHYKNDRWKKRIYQIKWIAENLQKNENKWYYYDIVRKRLLYLCGSLRNCQK